MAHTSYSINKIMSKVWTRRCVECCARTCCCDTSFQKINEDRADKAETNKKKKMKTHNDEHILPTLLQIRRRRTWKRLTKTSILITDMKVNYLIQPTEGSASPAVWSDSLYTQSLYFHKREPFLYLQQFRPQPT